MLTSKVAVLDAALEVDPCRHPFHPFLVRLFVGDGTDGVAKEINAIVAVASQGKDVDQMDSQMLPVRNLW